MPRYYFHLRDGPDELLDEEGLELPDAESIAETALKSARDVMAGEIRRGVVDLRYRIEAEDEAGQVVHSPPSSRRWRSSGGPEGPGGAQGLSGNRDSLMIERWIRAA